MKKINFYKFEKIKTRYEKVIKTYKIYENIQKNIWKMSAKQKNGC